VFALSPIASSLHLQLFGAPSSFISSRCHRSYSMYVPSNLYRLILVSISWARSSSPSHPPKPHNFSSKLSHNTLPLPPPSPLIFSTISWATGLHSTHDPPSPPLASSFHERHFMFIHSTVLIIRGVIPKALIYTYPRYNITCASFRCCRDWVSFQPADPITVREILISWHDCEFCWHLCEEKLNASFDMIMKRSKRVKTSRAKAKMNDHKRGLHRGERHRLWWERQGSLPPSPSFYPTGPNDAPHLIIIIQFSITSP